MSAWTLPVSTTKGPFTVHPQATILLPARGLMKENYHGRRRRSGSFFTSGDIVAGNYCEGQHAHQSRKEDSDENMLVPSKRSAIVLGNLAFKSECSFLWLVYLENISISYNISISNCFCCSMGGSTIQLCSALSNEGTFDKYIVEQKSQVPPNADFWMMVVPVLAILPVFFRSLVPAFLPLRYAITTIPALTDQLSAQK